MRETPIPTVRSPKAKTAPKKPAVKTPVKKASAAKPVAKKTTAKTTSKPAAKKSAVVAKAPAKKAAAEKFSPLCKLLVKAIDTNKGEDIVSLVLKDKCSFADYMIVASGRSSRHVSALAHYVVDELKKQGLSPLSVEGKETGDWVLIDAGDIVIHLFRPEIRQFYNIEKMWALPAIQG